MWCWGHVLHRRVEKAGLICAEARWLVRKGGGRGGQDQKARLGNRKGPGGCKRVRLVVRVESAGKKVCDLEGGGLAAAGKIRTRLIPQVSRQGGPSGSFQPSFQRGELRGGVVLFSWALCPHGDALLKSEQATAASSAFGMLAETRPALISTTGT